MKKLLLLSILMLVACDQQSDNELGMNDKLKNIDAIFEAYDGSVVPGAAVMVIQDGELVMQKGYGIADFEEKTPVSPSTNFRLASVTKQFTATAILKLVETGRLSLDASLTDIFPDFPDYGQSMTVKGLLEHTTGLVDYEKITPDDLGRQVRDQDVLDLMKGIDEVYFPAGDKHQYSNTGYALLALIVEKVSGQTFPEFLSENIFVPLNMSNTLAHINGVNEVPDRAYGYTLTDDNVEFTDQSTFSAVLGDGGVYSNLEDLYKWDQSLYNSPIIDQKYIDMAFTEGKTNDGNSIGYGLGWRIENYKGMDVVYHTGSSIGFRNILYRIPSKNFTAIILTNRDAGGEFSTLAMVHRIVDEFY